MHACDFDIKHLNLEVNTQILMIRFYYLDTFKVNLRSVYLKGVARQSLFKVVSHPLFYLHFRIFLLGVLSGFLLNKPELEDSPLHFNLPSLIRANSLM